MLLFCLAFFSLASLVSLATAVSTNEELYKLPASLGAFPKEFKYGVSTSSYQVEGGWLEGGKGPSVLDVGSHKPYEERSTNTIKEEEEGCVGIPA